MNPVKYDDVIKCCRCHNKFVRKDGEFMCIRHNGRECVNYYICGDCKSIWRNQFDHKLTSNNNGITNWDDIFFKQFINEKQQKLCPKVFIFR